MFYLESDKLASLAHKANIVQVFETHVIQLTTYYFLGILQLLVPGEREENMYESAEMSPPSQFKQHDRIVISSSKVNI